jgi:hypothetical protein
MYSVGVGELQKPAETAVCPRRWWADAGGTLLSIKRVEGNSKSREL